VRCLLQGKFWLHAATHVKYSLAVTNQILASNHLTVADSMRSSKSTLHYISSDHTLAASLEHTGRLLSAGPTIAGSSKHDNQDLGQQVLDSEGQHVEQQAHSTTTTALIKHLLRLFNIRPDCSLQGQPLLDAATMTTRTLASEYLTVEGSMSSSKSALHCNSPCQICAASSVHSSFH